MHIGKKGTVSHVGEVGSSSSPSLEKLGLMFSLLQNHKLVNSIQPMHNVGLGFSKVSI